MTSSFDPAALVTAIITGRKLEPVYITGARDRLDFTPGTFGDAEYITDTALKLNPTDRARLIVAAGSPTDGDREIAYRALHVGMDKAAPSREAYMPAAAALAILIARELHVEIK